MAGEAPEWAPEFRRQVEHALVERGWKQADLARALGHGNTARLSQWMTGKHRPPAVDVIAVAEQIGLDPVALARVVGYELGRLRAEPEDIQLSASGTDLEELRTLDPEGYELLMNQARLFLERARERKEGR